MTLQKELKAARMRLNLTTKEAASLLDVSEVTFQRWEGQTSSSKTIPFAYWELFLLKTGCHPTHLLIEKLNFKLESVMRIEDLNTGDYAYQNGEYAVVKEINGKLYYGSIDHEDIDENAEIHDVCDMDDQEPVN